MNYFAHAGEDHDLPESVIQFNLPPDVIIGVALIFGLALLWAFTTFNIKLSLAVRLLLTAVTLLFVGVAGYSTAPVISIVSLSLGMAITLFSTLVQMAKPQQPAAK